MAGGGVVVMGWVGRWWLGLCGSSSGKIYQFHEGLKM